VLTVCMHHMIDKTYFTTRSHSHKGNKPPFKGTKFVFAIDQTSPYCLNILVTYRPYHKENNHEASSTFISLTVLLLGFCIVGPQFACTPQPIYIPNRLGFKPHSPKNILFLHSRINAAPWKYLFYTNFYTNPVCTTKPPKSQWTSCARFSDTMNNSGSIQLKLSQ